MSQIKEKGYADWIKGYTGDILLVGVNYSRQYIHVYTAVKFLSIPPTQEIDYTALSQKCDLQKRIS